LFCVILYPLNILAILFIHTFKSYVVKFAMNGNVYIHFEPRNGLSHWNIFVLALFTFYIHYATI